MTRKLTDTSYSSFWLFERRKEDELPQHLNDKFATPIGRQAPTRGSVFSEFNPTLCKKIIGFWSNEGEYILDPFAGRTRALIANFMHRKYIGFELSKAVCADIENSLTEYNQHNLIPLDAKPLIINDDSHNITKYDIPYVDLVFTCPPYWNIEKYKSGEGDLSEIDNYDLFMQRYVEIIAKSVYRLKFNGYLVLVVGDFRIDGRFVPFHADNIQGLRQIAMLKLHDVITVQSVSFDIANLRFGQFAQHKFTAKAHEYILVYKRG